MSVNGNSVAAIIFQRSRTEQLVAEIAFGPAIAFAVTQTSPSGIQGALLSWIMAALIVTPIFRYLVFTDRIEHFDRLLDLTVRPVELFALLGLVQVFAFLGSEIVQPVIEINVFEATALVTLIATILYILVFELIFQKYRFSWGTLFYVRRVALERAVDIKMDDVEEVMVAIGRQDSLSASLKFSLGILKLALIRVTFGQVAFHLLKGSIPDRDDEAINELREFVEMNQDNDPNADSMGIWFAFLVSALFVLPAFAVIAGLISLAVGTFGAIFLVLVIMRLTKHIVALSYIAFGTMDYEQFATTNKRWVVMTAGYTLAVYLLIFYPA